MGVTASRLLIGLCPFSKVKYQIAMLGLDAAGKTTLLIKIKHGMVRPTIPTFGFNVEDIEYNNITMTVLDPGGQEAIRPIWHHYFSSTQAMIFVVDSSDRSRINETRDAFHWILDDILPGTLNEENLRNFLILVYANKQDLPNAMTTSEIAYKLRLHSLRAGSWCIQATCALSGEGLDEGLDWLTTNIEHRI